MIEEDHNLVFYDTPYAQVAYLGTDFVGFCAIEVKNDHFLLKKCFVESAYRRRGYGSKFISCLKKRLKQTRKVIRAEVKETDLEYQLFLKKNGFFCYKTENELYYFEYHYEL